MKFRTSLTVTGAALALALAPTASASADPSSSPAQICKTQQVPAGPNGELAPLAGEGGYFSKQGGCASTVAHGAWENPDQLSALTTRAGYVQTCQLIREVEGFPFDFGYPFIPFDQDVASIGECADVLHAIHNFMPPMA